MQISRTDPFTSYLAAPRLATATWSASASTLETTELVTTEFSYLYE